MSFSLPSELLTFFGVVALLWTLASVLVVFMCLRAMLTFSREFATKAELSRSEQRFEGWLRDTDERHSSYVLDAKAAREHLQATVSTLSNDVHELIGRLDRNP